MAGISYVAVAFAVCFVLTGTSAGGAVLSKQDQTLYKKAFDAARDKKWKTAIRLSRKGRSKLPAKVILWLRAQSGGSGASFDNIATFLEDPDNWPRKHRLRLRAEEIMKAATDEKRTLAWFDKYPPLSAPGVIHQATALHKSNRDAEAVNIIRDAWINLDMHRADERVFRKQFRKHLTKMDNIKRLNRLIWDRRVSAARRQMRRVEIGYRHLSQAKIMLMRRIGGVDPAVARIPPALQDDPGLLFERMRWRRRRKSVV